MESVFRDKSDVGELMESGRRSRRRLRGIGGCLSTPWILLVLALYIAGFLGTYYFSPSRSSKLWFTKWSEMGTLNPYPNKPRITFPSDGTFKLAVFSDLHFGENPWEDWGPEQDRKSLKVMTSMLALEKPDYVVINGDLITGDNTFRENSTKLIDQIVGPLNQAGVPFSSAHGNHDNHVNITHLEEIEREQLVAPRSYTRRAPPGVGGEGGEGNYWVPIYAKETDKAPSLILWFFDSRSGISPGANPVVLPDWVDVTVATWIQSETEAMEKAWGPSNKRAAFAFVHIPPHVMETLQKTLDSEIEPGLNDDLLGVGATQSSADILKFGADRDKPFWDALNVNIKNLHAVVSGHAHGNEWCKRDPIKNVILCFNKHTGYGGYSHKGWGHGIRVFNINLAQLTNNVHTYIRMENGTSHAEVTLNALDN